MPSLIHPTGPTRFPQVLAMLLCASPTWGGESFDYFRNAWSVIGLKDYRDGTRVAPENELIIGPRGKAGATQAGNVRVRMRFGRQLTPLSRTHTKRLLDGWLPVILIAAHDGWVRYDFTLWATPLPDVGDWQQAFGWPTEGENFLNWITVKISNTGIHGARAQLRIEQYDPAAQRGIAEREEFAWSLAAGESTACVVRIPWTAVEPAADFDAADPALWLERTVLYWRNVLANAAQIDVPCKKANQALLAAHVCQLIASDHGQLHGGEGFYDEFYIRDGAYQVMELEEAGLWDSAAKAMESYLSHQREDGRFESQKNQFDANGQALWALWQYAKITGDRPWLERAYVPMRRAVDWMIQARRQAASNSPFAGVLPAAPADGEYLWSGDYHIVGYDFWNLRGLICTADAARTLGKTDEALQLQREADDYRSAVEAAWRRTELAFFAPSWETEGTHWGNTETLWPTEIFPRDDPRVAALLDEVRTRHGGGFLEGTMRWLGGTRWQPPLPPGDAIHPYMSAYSTMASLARGEHEKVVEEFHWYLLHSTATHAFPEGIFHQRRFAWSDTIPHVTGASNYALLLRHMLIHERDEQLHLLSAVPDWWLDEGHTVRIAGAPTHFGVMGFEVRGVASGVEIQIDPPRRQLPKRIVLYLPESRPPVGSTSGIEVVLRTDQEQRWDFPTVVDRYRKQAPARFGLESSEGGQ